MVGKYSWAHRLQKRLAKSWARRHLRTIKESLFAVSVGSIPDAGRSCSTSLGVRGLLISSIKKTGVKGLELSIPSTSTNNVVRPSSVKVVCEVIHVNTLCTDPINLSQDPKKWLAKGVLKCQSSSFSTRNSVICL